MNLTEFITKYKDIGSVAFSTHETKYNSYNMGKYVSDNNIPGDIIECGVAAGSNFAFLMLGSKASTNQTNRTCWGFDSFEGIQLAGKKDTEQPGLGKITHNVNVPDDDLLKSSGVTSIDKQTVIQNLTKWNLYDNVQLVEGWIQKTLTEELIKQIPSIAILRLDMDIYAPTKYALEKLFPLVSPGGVVIIDDWGLQGARSACNEYFDSIGFVPNYIKVPNSDPVYFIKP
jgi:O-methyltransferase